MFPFILCTVKTHKRSNLIVDSIIKNKNKKRYLKTRVFFNHHLPYKQAYAPITRADFFGRNRTRYWAICIANRWEPINGPMGVARLMQGGALAPPWKIGNVCEKK